MADTLPANMISVALAIVCEGDRADNPPIFDPGPFPSFKKIIFDNKSSVQYQGWFIERYEDQSAYTIRNAGSGYYASASDDKVGGTSEFDPATCLWYIEKAGDVHYEILVPDRDRVWTVEESGDTKIAFLRHANGSPFQRFIFEFAMQK